MVVYKGQECPPASLQILSLKSIWGYAMFRPFYQVNISRQHVLNRNDGVGLLLRFSGVHRDSYSDEIWDGVVVVGQHGIQIG